MESFKAAVLQRLANTLPDLAVSPAHVAIIERRIQQAFPALLRIPTHPTYASMIQTAIRELNEEGGSLESSISEYIVANYEGLPWAHKTYLSHYLNKLCENGEITCTSSKCYTIPGSTRQPKSKKKQLRSKPGRKRHEGVTGEGNLSGGELIPISIPILMNDNEVCFQDEETQVFMRSRLKRRSSSVVYEEDEEAGEKDTVQRDCDMVRSDQTITVIEEQHELSELNHIDEIGKSRGLRQLGFGTDDKVNGTGIMEQSLPNTQQAVGCEGGTEIQGGLIETPVEELIPKEAQNEVLALNHDSIEGRTELLLPLVLSTSGKRSPGECKNEAGVDTSPQFPESYGADLMPFDSEDPSKKSAEDCSSCPTNMMIVPFEEGAFVPVWWEKVRSVSNERKEIIVCGLPSGLPSPTVRKPKKRSKDCQKKPLLLAENIVSASPVTLVTSKVLQDEHMNGFSLQPGHETKFQDEQMNEVSLQPCHEKGQPGAQSIPTSEGPEKGHEKGQPGHETKFQDEQTNGVSLQPDHEKGQPGAQSIPASVGLGKGHEKGQPGHETKQSREQKRDGRGRRQKQNIVINGDAETPLNLLVQCKNKQPKRDGRGRPQKRKEARVDEAMFASLTLRNQQKNEPSEPEETHQHSQLQSKQSEGDGSPQKQTEEDAAVAVQLDERLQEEGPSKLAVQQNKWSRRGVRGRPRKQVKVKGTKEEEVEPPLNFDQEDLSEPATHQIQCKKQKRDDGCGTPLLKEDVGTKEEGVTAALNLDNEEELEEGPLLFETQFPMEQEQQGQGTTAKQKPAKSDNKELEGPPVLETKLPTEQEQHGQGKTPKQKPAKTRAVEVPLSSKAALRSRAKCQSQSGASKRNSSSI